MAESPRNPDPAARYAELEQAYTEDRWADLVRLGDALVADLKGSGSAAHQDLLGRAQLLIGHARFYGLGDAEAARPHYREVLASSGDASLRQLASTALEACESALAAAPDTESPSTAPSGSTGQPASGADSFLAVVDAARQRSQTGSAATGAATPWLAKQATEPSEEGATALTRLDAEVVEEPELVEVAQADPALAEELELKFSEIRERRQRARSQAGDAPSTELEPAPAEPLQPSAAQGQPFPPTATDPQPVGIVFEPPAEDPSQAARRDLDHDPELERCLLRVVLQS